MASGLHLYLKQLQPEFSLREYQENCCPVRGGGGRGRQGDPMSPLQFVLAVELLQCIINKACQHGLFQMPIPTQSSHGFPVIQYTDDTIIIMKASQKELLCLMALLETFGQSTGLRVNYVKSGLVPLNLSVKSKPCLSPTLVCLWAAQSQKLSTLLL
jgi:hypothetical protein